MSKLDFILVSSVVLFTFTISRNKYSKVLLLSDISYMPGGKVYSVVCDGNFFMSNISKIS